MSFSNNIEVNHDYKSVSDRGICIADDLDSRPHDSITNIFTIPAISNLIPSSPFWDIIEILNYQ